MTDRELTRRDAIAALTAAGVAVSAGAALTWDQLTGGDDSDDHAEVELTAHHQETLVAVAEVVYPSAVSGIPEFVESYVVGRVRDRSERAAGVADAVEELDAYAQRKRDADFRALDAETRDEILNQMGVDIVDSNPEGFGAERVRFYLVNELLFALYASPTGGELVGLENPQGYPGGTGSYQRGPR